MRVSTGALELPRGPSWVHEERRRAGGGRAEQAREGWLRCRGLAVFTQTQTSTGGRARQGKGHEPFPSPRWLVRVPDSQAPQSHNTRFARRKAKGRRGEKGKRRKKEQMSSVWFAWHWLVNSRTTETLLSASPLLAANPRTERSSDDVSACSTRESNPFDRESGEASLAWGADLDAAAGPLPPVATGSGRAGPPTTNA